MDWAGCFDDDEDLRSSVTAAVGPHVAEAALEAWHRAKRSARAQVHSMALEVAEAGRSRPAAPSVLSAPAAVPPGAAAVARAQAVFAEIAPPCCE